VSAGVDGELAAGGVGGEGGASAGRRGVAAGGSREAGLLGILGLTNRVVLCNAWSLPPVLATRTKGEAGRIIFVGIVGITRGVVGVVRGRRGLGELSRRLLKLRPPVRGAPGAADAFAGGGDGAGGLAKERGRVPKLGRVSPLGGK
jgi:hypothetical protein